MAVLAWEFGIDINGPARYCPRASTRAGPPETSTTPGLDGARGSAGLEGERLETHGPMSQTSVAGHCRAWRLRLRARKRNEDICVGLHTRTAYLV